MGRQAQYSPHSIKTYPYNTGAPEWINPTTFRIGPTTTQMLSPDQKLAGQYVRFLPDRSRSEQAYSDIGTQMAALMAANKPVTDDLKSKLAAFYADAANYGPHGIMEGPPPAQPAVAAPVNSAGGALSSQDILDRQRAEIMRLMNAPTGGRFVMSRGVPPGTRDAVRQMEYQMNSPVGQADRKLQFLNQLAELDKSQMELAQRQRGEAAETGNLAKMGLPALLSLAEATKGTAAAYPAQREIARMMNAGGMPAGGATHQMPVQDRGNPPIEQMIPLEERVRARSAQLRRPPNEQGIYDYDVPKLLELIGADQGPTDPREAAMFLARQGKTRDELRKYQASPVGTWFRPTPDQVGPLNYLTWRWSGHSPESVDRENALRQAAAAILKAYGGPGPGIVQGP